MVTRYRWVILSVNFMQALNSDLHVLLHAIIHWFFGYWFFVYVCGLLISYRSHVLWNGGIWLNCRSPFWSKKPFCRLTSPVLHCCYNLSSLKPCIIPKAVIINYCFGRASVSDCLIEFCEWKSADYQPITTDYAELDSFQCQYSMISVLCRI